jgi:hypothetical protein
MSSVRWRWPDSDTEHSCRHRHRLSGRACSRRLSHPRRRSACEPAAADLAARRLRAGELTRSAESEHSALPRSRLHAAGGTAITLRGRADRRGYIRYTVCRSLLLFPCLETQRCQLAAQASNSFRQITEVVSVGAPIPALRSPPNSPSPASLMNPRNSRALRESPTWTLRSRRIQIRLPPYPGGLRLLRPTLPLRGASSQRL